MNTPLSQHERKIALRQMAQDGLEVLVVGGGITGSGVVLEATARGYRAGLIEKADFCSGTSSKSTKLAHGGIRYLAHFDFALVYEGLIERGRMIRNAPHLVKPLGFVLPLYKENKRPMDVPFVPPGGIGLSWIMQAGLALYDVMSGRLGIKMHRRISIKNALTLAPCLKTEGLNSSFIYYDGQTDDTLLTMTVLRTAAQHGALLANYAELIGFEQAANGGIKAALVRDTINNDEYRIPVGTVINAAGVFAGRVESMAGTSNISIKPAKGVHLTVPREAVNLDEYAVVLPETPDGRLLFMVPWNTRVTIGTTDTKGGDIDQPLANDDDIDYLLRTTNLYMRTRLTRDDIISSWAGYRPLISPANGGNGDTSKLSRTHVVMDGPGGMVTIVGGKLTTYRRMAEDTLDHVAKRSGKAITHPTQNMLLDGAVGAQAANAAIDAAAQPYGWNADVVKRLKQYGSEAHKLLTLCAEDVALAQPIVPDLPYIMAEVVYACRYEMAMQLDDMITRRLHLNFEDWSRGIKPSPAIAQVMAGELGWSISETAAQVAGYAVVSRQ